MRDIPRGHGVCTVCDEVHPLSYSKARIGQFTPIYTHGPRGNRCPGSRQRTKGWLDAVGLPTWDQMSDTDKSAALMHVWKCYWENSAAYAREHYPARYHDHPELAALDERVASRHARVATGGYDAILNRLGHSEFDRLHSLAGGGAL